MRGSRSIYLAFAFGCLATLAFGQHGGGNAGGSSGRGGSGATGHASAAGHANTAAGSGAGAGAGVGAGILGAGVSAGRSGAISTNAAGPINAGGRPYPLRNDIALPTGLNPQAAGYTGIAPGGLRTIGPRSRYPYLPYIGSPIYYPGAFDYGSSSVMPYNDQGVDPNGPGPDATADANMMAAQDAMAEQIRQLSSDLQHMKDNAANSSPTIAPPSGPPSPAPSDPAAIPIQIVLRSGERITSKSYAVMSGMLWDFSSSRIRKIPIASVDVAASTKATEAAGAEFPELKR